jgi:hypothetical protein
MYRLESLSKVFNRQDKFVISRVGERKVGDVEIITRC